MVAISIIERVKLNYAICTIVFIILYTFVLSTFSAYLSKLYGHVLYFILAELIKLTIIQKVYNIDVSYSQDGIKKRRSNKFGESLKFAMLMILTCFCYAFIAIVMGAPPLENYEETFTLSALLTGLTLFPVSIFIGVSGTISILFTESFELTNVVSQAYLKFLKRNAFLVIFGAFVGSAVFPLDWDRPWQIYPIPNVVGAITAQMLGCFYCFLESMVKYRLGKKQS